MLLLIGVGLIVLGYALMLVDNASSENPVDSPLSLVVAPLLLLGGYLEIVYAILWRPRAARDEARSEAATQPQPARVAA